MFAIWLAHHDRTNPIWKIGAMLHCQTLHSQPVLALGWEEFRKRDRPETVSKFFPVFHTEHHCALHLHGLNVFLLWKLSDNFILRVLPFFYNLVVLVFVAIYDCFDFFTFYLLKLIESSLSLISVETVRYLFSDIVGVWISRDAFSNPYVNLLCRSIRVVYLLDKIVFQIVHFFKLPLSFLHLFRLVEVELTLVPL